MATADVLSKVEKTMRKYIESTATDKNSLKGAQLAKCFDACGLGQYKSTMDSSAFPKFQDKARRCSVRDCATKVIDATAAAEIGKKKSGGKIASLDDPEVIALADSMRAKIAAKADETPAGQKAVKVDKATERLTDTSKYTGSHKERFDASGKGKGIDGRADIAKNTGYVGNYKGEGTYEQK